MSFGVSAAQKHPNVERDIVYLKTEPNSYPFQVTKDHPLLVEGPSGDLVDVTAQDLLQDRRRIYDGTRFRRVTEAFERREATEVIEVTFLDDAAVLAWVLPKRPVHARPQLLDGAAVVCLGAPPQRTDAVFVHNTFLRTRGSADRDRQSSRRSRSADARLQGLSPLMGAGRATSSRLPG
ncbi:unnamed protein product [Prorocentrum cordatum]|uniref:Uncharacterized protein n=1 Tax=Prorocentrum cordatum TaxID=2364126 RepID=A0ABN9Y4J1_9DINO|nr:unnamed protein product [Polarella glacialis]